MVGLQNLDLYIGVRIPGPEHEFENKEMIFAMYKKKKQAQRKHRKNAGKKITALRYR